MEHLRDKGNLVSSINFELLCLYVAGFYMHVAGIYMHVENYYLWWGRRSPLHMLLYIIPYSLGLRHELLC